MSDRHAHDGRADRVTTAGSVRCLSRVTAPSSSAWRAGATAPGARVEAVASGRVWTGVAARSRGLVDRLGGLETAIDMARARAGIGRDEDLVVERLPKVKHSFLQSMLAGLFDEDDFSSLQARELPPVLRALIAMARLPVGQSLALMPYSIEVR
jgi:protease-4